MKYLEQDIKNKLLEKKREIISEAVKQANEQQVILSNHFEQYIIVEMEKKQKSSRQRYHSIIIQRRIV